jgi:hypothetical protein
VVDVYKKVGRSRFSGSISFSSHLIIPHKKESGNITPNTTTTITDMSNTFHGKCHCGQVEWDVTLEQKAHVLCHCGACQKIGGGGYSLNQIVPKQNFKVTKGALKDYTYAGDSGNKVHCYYCPNCTSHAYHHQEILGDK